VRASPASLVLLGTLAFGAAACRGGASTSDAPVESRRSGTAEREGYRPPADGILTPPQVEAFLKVRERTSRLLGSPVKASPPEGGEGISGATEARSAEMRAAREVGVPVDEHLWVRERVLEAEAATLTARLNADVLALLDRTLDSLRERRLTAPDDASRQLLDEQIASFGAEAARVRREAAEEEPAAIRANLRITAPYRARLSAIGDELARLRASATPTPPPR
jgi:hypothetical protein